MQQILVLGAGKIGSLIACLLAQSNAYRVCLADLELLEAEKVRDKINLTGITAAQVDANQASSLEALIKQQQFTAVISCLPYFCNPTVATVASRTGLHYFDLTEDIRVTEHTRALSDTTATALVPQCGLAPGFIGIVAHHLMSQFESVDSVKMRVGALPLHPSNALKYSLTWSTDGLINEYGNPCQGIEQGQLTELQPLEGLETIELDGLLYEAFNTSGGLGTLAETYQGQVRSMNYKTMRYPGHCEKIRLLMQDLRLNEDRETLKKVLERAIPKTKQDVVLIYASVTGERNSEFYEQNYVKKVYPQWIAGQLWSAIQVTTASGICSVVDLTLKNPNQFRGFIGQEAYDLADILNNPFGAYYADDPENPIEKISNSLENLDW